MLIVSRASLCGALLTSSEEMPFNVKCHYISQTYFFKTLINIPGILDYFPFHLSKGDFFLFFLPYPYPENEHALNDLINICFNLVARISFDGWKCFP